MSASEFDRDRFERIRSLQDKLEERYVRLAAGRMPFPARPFIDSHIRATLGELRVAYIQMYQTEDAFPNRGWFKDTYESLGDFATTFPTRSRLIPLSKAGGSLKALVAFPGLVTVLVLTGVSSWVSQILLDCFCHLFSVVALLTVGWILFSFVFGFLHKRKAFLAHDLYPLEAELFRELDREKRLEVQSDVIGWILAAFTFVVAGVILRNYIQPERYYLYLILGGASLTVSIAVGVSSLRRPWAWSRSN